MSLLVFLPALLVFSYVSEATQSNISLAIIDSEMCPSQPVTVRCELNGRQLLWICSDGRGNNPERQVHCGSGSDIRDLECDQGKVEVSLFSCDDSTIISDATFNATTTNDSLICADFANINSIRESVSFGVKVPSSPVISLLSVNSSDEITTQNVTFGWPFENNTNFVLSVTPTPPHCSEPCIYRTDQASLSILLLAGVQYNITGRAVKCNGTLSSNESLIGFILPVPLPTMMCMAVPTYDSVEQSLLKLNITWSPLMMSNTTDGLIPLIMPQNSLNYAPDVAPALSEYTVNYTTETQFIVQTVSPSSCFSQCTDTLSGDKVNNAIITVTVWAQNMFGRGEAALCNQHAISNYNNIVSVSVEVRDNAADISLRWKNIHSVSSNLIQIFCSFNSTYEELFLCGKKEGVDEENVTLLVERLDSKVTYFYRLEVFGEQPFVIQGNFTTMSPRSGSEDDDLAGLVIGTLVVVCIVISIIIIVIIIGISIWRKKTEAPKLKVSGVRGLYVTETTIIASSAEAGFTKRNCASYFRRGTKNSVLFFEKTTGTQLHVLRNNLDAPRGLAVDANGFIYIVDSNHHRILKYNNRYSIVQDIWKGNQRNVELQYPFGLCVVGEHVCVADKDNHRIQVFNLNLEPLTTFGGSVRENNQILQNPVGIAFDSTNEMYFVADQGNNSINKFDKDYEHIRQITHIIVHGQEPKKLGQIRGITISSIRQLVFITQPNRNKILCFNMEEKLVKETESWKGRKFKNPQVVALDPDDSTLYVGDDSGCLHKIALNEYLRPSIS